MKRDHVLAIVAQHQAELKAMGVKSLALFGSVARDEAKPDSDVDFLIDLGENLSPWFPVRLIRDLESLLERKVDVVTENGFKTRIRDRVLSEAVLL